MLFISLFFANAISLGLPTIRKPTTNDIIEITQTPNSTFELTPHTNFGNCSCDVSNKCDPYCCCDPDCQNITFPHCDDINISNGLRMCSDPDIQSSGKVIDWFLRTSLCIYKDNNPSPGDFYDLEFNFDDSMDSVETYPSSLLNVFDSYPETNNEHWTPFSQIGLLAFGTPISIPRRSSDGECVNQSLLYLEPIDEYCGLGDQSDVCNINLQLSECGQDAQCILNKINELNDCAGKYTYISVKWGQQPEAPPKTGYKLGELIDDGFGNPIKIGSNCINESWKEFNLQFGQQTDIICQIEDFNYTRRNSYMFDFKNESFRLSAKNYSISPPRNNMDDNIGAIKENIPEPFLARSELMIVETVCIIYKTIGVKENPQHIISDFAVYYRALPFHNATLRMIIRFFEQPNELNIVHAPSQNGLYHWLPF